MEKQKFKYFEVILRGGAVRTVKAPAGRLTLDYAAGLVPHWAKVDKSDILSVRGIEKPAKYRAK